MNMNYELDGNMYEVIITKKKNKNTYIKVKEDMKIYVTTNFLATKNYIKKLLEENENSLRKMIQTMCKRNEKNNLFFYLGNTYDIIMVSTIKNVEIDVDNNIIYVKDKTNLDKWYNNQIKNVFFERFIYNFNKFKECNKLPKLRIRKMKTRWGVYNRANHTVTLNSELIKYDMQDLDYVIIHELCHIIHFDHSKDFWNLVSLYCSNYKQIRKDLKE